MNHNTHFHNVLKVVCIFSKEVLTPPDFQDVYPYVIYSEKCYPWFKVKSTETFNYICSSNCNW